MRRRRPDAPAARLRALGVAVALVATGLAAARAGAQEPVFPTELQSIASVRFSGRHAVKASELYSVMKTKPPSKLPWRERPRLRQDFLRADTLAIETLYHQHGYLDARAHALVATDRRDPRLARITFRIEEGHRFRIRSVTITGTPSYPADELGRGLYARRGRWFNPAFLVADTARIADAYQERGFLVHSTASARRDSDGVSVRFDVVEGPRYHVGQVFITRTGTAHIEEGLVRRELMLRPGDPFRKSHVERSLEHLYQTGLFAQAQITPLPDSARRAVDFDLSVVERKPRWFDLGVGSGTTERFQFNGEWGHRNLAAQALQGVLGSQVAFDDSLRFQLFHASASLLQPWLLHTRTAGLISLYYDRRDDYRADSVVVVQQEGKGISLQASREVGRRGRIVLTQDNTFVLQRLKPQKGVPPDSVAARAAEFKPSYATHSLSLTGLRDLRDDPLLPTRGSTQALTAEIAGGPLQGSSSFSKFLMSSSWYTPTSNGWVLATRANGGIIRPFGTEAAFTPEAGVDPDVARVPLEDRFRIGGVNSVRGFKENEIPSAGGLAMVLVSAELRARVIGPVGVEVFADAGNVWARPTYVKAENFVPRFGHALPTAGDLRYVVGAGGTLLLPFGPLRVDFTWSLRPVDSSGRWLVAEPQFAIGPSF